MSDVEERAPVALPGLAPAPEAGQTLCVEKSTAGEQYLVSPLHSEGWSLGQGWGSWQPSSRESPHQANLLACGCRGLTALSWGPQG